MAFVLFELFLKIIKKIQVQKNFVDFYFNKTVGFSICY